MLHSFKEIIIGNGIALYTKGMPSEKRSLHDFQLSARSRTDYAGNRYKENWMKGL